MHYVHCSVAFNFDATSSISPPMYLYFVFLLNNFPSSIVPENFAWSCASHSRLISIQSDMQMTVFTFLLRFISVLAKRLCRQKSTHRSNHSRSVYKQRRKKRTRRNKDCSFHLDGWLCDNLESVSIWKLRIKFHGNIVFVCGSQKQVSESTTYRNISLQSASFSR